MLILPEIEILHILSFIYIVFYITVNQINLLK